MTTSQKQFKNLLAWEAFLHTARTGNITLTAQVLNIDGSAVSKCVETFGKVECGSFGADMKVELENDGPFTILWDSDIW